METISPERVLSIRSLPAAEFERLKAVADGFLPNPANSLAVVGEVDGEIVARMFLLSMVHLEGTWVREDHRKSMLGFRLMKRAIVEAQKAGLKVLMAYTLEDNAKLADYMKRLGFEQVPVLVWTKDI